MRRIYLAGAMSSQNCLHFLANLRRGLEVSKEAILHGHAVFSPFTDYSIFFTLKEHEQIPLEMIQAQSMRWLEVSEYVLVVPGWEHSQGTKAELARAKELRIPIRYYQWEKFDWLCIK